MSVFYSTIAEAGGLIESASKKAKSPQRFCKCGSRIWPPARWCKPCSGERLLEQARASAKRRRRKHG
jgi:uncharacterized OB-fold protein